MSKTLYGPDDPLQMEDPFQNEELSPKRKRVT
jgi:hypothetical protein